MKQISVLLMAAGFAAAGVPAAALPADTPPDEAAIEIAMGPSGTAAEPEKKPAPVIPVLDAQPGGADAEWAFLQAAGKDKEKEIAEMTLPQLEDWLALNPVHASAPDAQLLKASLHYRLEDHKSALVGLLKHFRLYPGVPASEEARRLFREVMDKKGDKKTRPVLEKLAGEPETTADDFNLSALLAGLSEKAGEAYYQPIAAEYRYFFNRFPRYPGNDMMRLALAELHRLNGEYLAARLAYEKMVALHPASPLLAKAKLALAEVLAVNLKEYDRAIEVYQDIAASFPGTDEAWTAYSRLPELAEKQKKYELAVGVYEKIIELYPDREEAYGAYKSEARVLRDRMDKFPEAVAVLVRLADKYKDHRSVEALLLAAEIYRKEMKDTAAEVAIYEKIAAEYEKDPSTPGALYSAGEIFFKVKDADKARGYYQKILELYPDSAESKKAEKRIAAIISGKF